MPYPVIVLRRLTWIALMLFVGVPFAADGVLAVARPIAAQDGDCRVVRVVDGDTVTLWCAGAGVERARLVGFDAPELFSPGCMSELVAAQAAKWALRGYLVRGGVRLERGRLDRYQRRLVTVWVKQVPLAALMVKGGDARAYGGGIREGWCE